MTLRGILVGLLFSFFIGIVIPYNDMVIYGEGLANDFSTPGAFFLFFILVGIINVILKKIKRNFALTEQELLVIFIMMIVASAIPSMGLSEYLLPIISAPFYYATAENKWAEIIQPHIKPWMVPQDSNAIRYFYEGLPKGASIPWGVWIKPLCFWGIFLITLYFVMICMMVILRKQWVERERLLFPITYLPLEMVKEDKLSPINPFFKSKLMWMGFVVPFVIIGINNLHQYHPFIPYISLVKGVPIFRNTTNLIFSLSFPMLGFGYLISLEILFSLWFFNLLATVQEGIFNITGFSMTENLMTGSARQAPIFAHQGMGAMIVLVLFGLWIAKNHLKDVFKAVFKKNSDIDDSGEILSYRVAVIGMFTGLLFMTFWLNMSGIPLWVVPVFLFGAFLLFIGVTRLVVEGGLAEVRATMISPSFVVSGLGSTALSYAGLTSLGFSYAWCVDIRIFVMGCCANGLKIAERMKKKRPLFWAMMLAIVVSMISSIWMILKLGYKYGAINANLWFFQAGPIQGFNFVAFAIRYPTGVNWRGWLWTGVGGGIMVFLMFMHHRFLWWPLHPLGFPISSVWIMDELWFTLFVVWLIKGIILRYGGYKLYRGLRPFFLGLVLGEFTSYGFWVMVRFFYPT